MKNWKTFVFGALLALGAASKPIAERRPPTLTEIFEVAGAFGLGNAAKDKDVTGAGMTARRLTN